MSFEDQIRSDLGGIREPEALAPPADLADTVLIAMRRQTRRRAMVVAGALIIAVATASVTAPAWLSAPPRPGQVVPTDEACGGPLPSRAPSSTREHFDLLTREIDASGVTGYQVRAELTSTYYQGTELSNAAGDRTVGVILLAAGVEAHYVEANGEAVPFDPSTGEPAGSVGGAPAYWLPAKRFVTGSDKNQQGLAWQWAPGAWAIVFAAITTAAPQPTASTPSTPEPLSTVERTELRSIAAQAAPQIVVGVGTPVTSPFSMPVPDCTRLAVSVLTYDIAGNGATHTSLLLGFDTADRADLKYPPPGFGEPSLVVSAQTDPAPDGMTNLPPYPENLGHPAYVDEGMLFVTEVFGLMFRVLPWSMPNADTETEKADLAADIFRSITVYPGAAAGPAAWGDPIVP